MKEGLQVTKFSVYGNATLLESLLEELNTSFDKQVSAFFSDPDGIDIMPYGVDKGVGVTALMRTLALQSKEVACIGDSFNDIAMFKVTANSYAMANSREGVKAAANHVVRTVADAVKGML